MDEDQPEIEFFLVLERIELLGTLATKEAQLVAGTVKDDPEMPIEQLRVYHLSVPAHLRPLFDDDESIRVVAPLNRGLRPGDHAELGGSVSNISTVTLGGPGDDVSVDLATEIRLVS